MRERVTFQEEGHRYLVGGVQYPSVTQILKSAGLTQDYSQVPQHILQWKADLGSQIHRAIELDVLDDLGDYDPIIEPYLTAWRQIKNDLQIEPLAPEQPIFSSKYRYCGKPDLIAMIRGKKRAIIDYKNSAVVEMVSVGAQLAGYEIAYREWDNVPDLDQIERYAIKFYPDGRYKLIQFTDSMDKNTFLWAVSLYHRQGAMKYV